MSVINKIGKLIQGSSTQEKSWLSINNELYEFYVERLRIFRDFWIEEAKHLSGLPFLEMVSSSWGKLKKFTKFCQIFFIKLESFTLSYKNQTLDQNLLQLQTEWFNSANDKITKSLLDELKKDGEQGNCPEDLISNFIRMEFEVNYA